jgi:hypothetical protein
MFPVAEPEDVDAADVVLRNAEATSSLELNLAAVKFPAGHPLEQGSLAQQPINGGVASAQVYHLLPAPHIWSEKDP